MKITVAYNVRVDTSEATAELLTQEDVDLITNALRELPDDLEFPLIIKPNAEGPSKGVTQDSVVDDRATCIKRIDRLLESHRSELVVEQFIPGRELSVPILEAFPGKILEIVEHTFRVDRVEGKYNIYGYEMKTWLYRRSSGSVLITGLSHFAVNWSVRWLEPASMENIGAIGGAALLAFTTFLLIQRTSEARVQ